MESVPIVRKAGWTSGPIWMGPENLFPRFEPQTIQSVKSRYSDYTISTANWLELIILISIKFIKPDFTAVQTGDSWQECQKSRSSVSFSVVM